MKMSEIFFYAEEEGLLPTRTGKLNAVIAAIRNYPSSAISFSIFQSILRKNGLEYSELSPRELKYIETKIQ